MTVKQFRKKVAIARKTGSAELNHGCILHYTGSHWSIRNGANTIETADAPEKLEYLFD